MARTPAEVGRAVEGVRLGAALPGLQEELSGMEASLLTRVFAAIEEKKLTPEQALWSWMELYGYRRLARRLRVRSALGAAELETLTQEAQDA